MIAPQEALRVILEVVRVLDDLQVPYAVGGSLASSMHGIPRSTQNVVPLLIGEAIALLVPEKLLQDRILGAGDMKRCPAMCVPNWMDRSSIGWLLSRTGLIGPLLDR